MLEMMLMPALIPSKASDNRETNNKQASSYDSTLIYDVVSSC